MTEDQREFFRILFLAFGCAAIILAVMIWNENPADAETPPETPQNLRATAVGYIASAQWCPLGRCPITLSPPRRVPGTVIPSALRTTVSGVVPGDTIGIQKWGAPIGTCGMANYSIERSGICAAVPAKPGVYVCTVPAYLTAFFELVICRRGLNAAAWLPEAQVSITTQNGPSWMPQTLPTVQPTVQVDAQCCCAPDRDTRGFLCRSVP